MLERQGFSITDFKVSAGQWIPAYQKAALRLIPVRARSTLICWLAQNLPALFGAQHVVRAVLVR
jgi:hypothetical protein